MRLAVGETFILLTPPSPSLLKHLLKGEGLQQNDSLADSYMRLRAVVWARDLGSLPIRPDLNLEPAMLSFLLHRPPLTHRHPFTTLVGVAIAGGRERDGQCRHSLTVAVGETFILLTPPLNLD